MKKRLIVTVAVACAVLPSCSRISDEGTVTKNGVYDTTFRTIEIEGCEYIVVENSIKLANNYSFAITHKGNCKNPIHQYH